MSVLHTASRARVAVLLATFGYLLAAPAAAAQSSTLVFLVRHAEKAAEPANDPPLTPAGEARARALADLLEHAGIGVVISTPYARARSTAAPAASRAGLTVETIDVAGGVAAHARTVADAVRRHAGKAVLVVGHSNTVPAIAAALGAPRLPDLCDEEYDQLYVLELPAAGAARFARMRFGEVSSRTGCSQMQGPRDPLNR